MYLPSAVLVTHVAVKLCHSSVKRRSFVGETERILNA